MDPNQQLFSQVNDLARHTPWLHGIVAGYAGYGVLVFAALVLLVVWQARHAPHARLAAAVWAGLATVLAVGVNQPAVALAAEPRPYQTHPGILVLVARSSDWSFPSDHAVMAGACAVGLFIASRRIGAVAMAAALLMAAARVYVGAHYPLDVAAGLLLGALVAGVGWLVLRKPLVLAVSRLRHVSLVRSWCEPRPGV
ncbi:phosphatase PAP2 family protein [Intrasporangium sp. YIM S08009]|uniref:phosphatase PAP2 family protein n=1 Tax=Intrasporangium zincisolvens TaxID=3080018 RepID=UPI002B0547E9|nr:phosphatase PAP2 family protein [Intrasporangium sp. YIM S08009]